MKKNLFADAKDLLGAALVTKEKNPKAVTPYEIAQLRTLLAIAHHGSGDQQDAQACLLDILALTEHDGVVRLLADEGAAIAPILDALATAAGPMSPHASYYDRIFDALGSKSTLRKVDSFIVGSELHKPLEDDTLSRRESDVLELVVQKLSNKQIARTLFITPETVKWHLRNIYRKFGVSDRRCAAQIGRQMPHGAQAAVAMSAPTRN